MQPHPRLKSLLQPILIGLVVALAACNPMPPLPGTPTLPVLRVAVLSPTRGELSPVGLALRNGIQMAFDEWNRQGGVAGHHLDWQLYHTDCTFDSGRQATRQAVSDGRRFILGPVCSEAAIAAAAEAQAANVLMIAPTATHPRVTVDNRGSTRPTVFRMSYAAGEQANAAAQFARRTLNASRAAIIKNPRDSHATHLANVFARRFATEGGSIVYQAEYIPGHPDLAEVLFAGKQAGAELIYLPGNSDVINPVAERLRETEQAEDLIPTILLGSDHWQPDILNLTAIEGSYFPLHFTLSNAPPLLRQWAEAYKSTYATAPNAVTALGYDSATLLAQALKQSGHTTPTEIAKTIEQIKLDGVTGQTGFNREHNPEKPIPFVLIKDGTSVFVANVLPQPPD